MIGTARWKINDFVRNGSSVEITELYSVLSGKKYIPMIRFIWWSTDFDFDSSYKVISNTGNEEAECFFKGDDIRKLELWAQAKTTAPASEIPTILGREFNEMKVSLRGAIQGKKFGL